MSHALIHYSDSSAQMKVFDALILAAGFAFNTLALGIDWPFVAVAVGGAFSGSMVLAYFRRDPRKLEQIFKVLCSSVSGIVFGAVVQEYLGIANPKYIAGLFFASSLVSLVLLRALLSLTERNAAEILTGFIYRLLNVQLENGKPKRQRRRRGVTFDDTKDPNKE